METLFQQPQVQMVRTKEYILVRERTAAPCVFKTFAHPTSPPARSVRQSGIVGEYWERLGGQMFGSRRGVLSVLLLIYILWEYCSVNLPYDYCCGAH